MNGENSITEHLFYPTSNLQAGAAIGDELPAGFDIMNLFGSIIPGYIDPLGETDLLNEREMHGAIP